MIFGITYTQWRWLFCGAGVFFLLRLAYHVLNP